MWFKMLIPIFLEILKKILENKFPESGPVVLGVSPVGDDGFADRMATQLEAALEKAPKSAGPGFNAGLIGQIQQLISLLRTKPVDWAAVVKLVLEIIGTP